MSPIRRSRASWCRPTCRIATCGRIRWRCATTSWRWRTRPARMVRTPAGIELFDISTPEQPRSISFIDRSGPRSRGVHQLWFIDGKTIHCSSGAADFMPRNLKDDQAYTRVRRERSRETARDRPLVVSGDGGARRGAAGAAASEVRHGVAGAQYKRISGAAGPRLCRLHRRRRVRAGHLRYRQAEAGGALESAPAISRLHPYRDAAVRSRPARGERRVRADRRCGLAEAGVAAGCARRKTTWSRCPLCRCRRWRTMRSAGATARTICGRIGPGPAFQSSTLVFGTYFGGGLRVHDITDPLQPKEVASFIPDPPEGSPMKAAMINDVYVDENRSGLRGGSLRRRAVRAGDDDLTLPCESCPGCTNSSLEELSASVCHTAPVREDRTAGKRTWTWQEPLVDPAEAARRESSPRKICSKTAARAHRRRAPPV